MIWQNPQNTHFATNLSNILYRSDKHGMLIQRAAADGNMIPGDACLISRKIDLKQKIKQKDRKKNIWVAAAMLVTCSHE